MLLEEVDALWREKSSADTVSPVLYIHNLVGTGMVRSSNGLLDLKCMSSLIPNSVFHKQKFAAITIRLESPTCTALLFTSGKMVLTGCKTYIECIACALQVVALLRNNMRGTKFQLCSVCIQNMVGNVDLNLTGGASINLHRMQSEHGLYCTYQKKMFPGLIYRPDNSPIVLLIFTSGKIVVTGGKSVCDMQAGWNVLWPFVQRYVTQT
jgi:transcription initiation factor TFIID TATA-box-binding protein